MSIITSLESFFTELDTVVSDVETVVKMLQVASTAVAELNELGTAVVAEVKLLAADLQSAYAAFAGAKTIASAKVLRETIVTMQAYLASQQKAVAFIKLSRETASAAIPA